MLATGGRATVQRMPLHRDRSSSNTVFASLPGVSSARVRSLVSSLLLLASVLWLGCDRNVEPYQAGEQPSEPDLARIFPGPPGGVGSAAIQLAKKMGCTIITTVGSDAKIEPAKALGADHVINYREDRFEGVVRKLTRKKGVDVVFEHVGADTWAGSMLAMKRGGRLVTCGSTSGISTNMNLMMLFQQQLRLIGSFGCRMENMANAMQKMARGIVHPVVDTEVGFDGIGDALARMETRDVFGKIMLRVS